MVVETRRGKRKENPTEEEAPRVKFAKTGSRENVEKTTTEESETRAVEVVESTAKTTDVSIEKTKTTDVSMEKTRKDSTENTAEMTEPFNVVADAAPTTLNKGPGDEENEETASVDEENVETASGDEENEETASGDEVNEKTASGDEVNEGSEEVQEKPDGEKESSNEDHEYYEEEPSDGENEVNARSEEEQANGEGIKEANENGNPPEPQDLDGNEAPEAIKPTIMFFKPSE
ncbi:myelin transcription factor 1-like protein [Brassica rapa]|uniref:myelin transcription factor 1-like protein n=1 Tax=Brassica campestris TaxID=3711 RepID=UPI00142D41AE|nr:myelin transcription factor 1-like protein [Brassica rapa]